MIGEPDDRLGICLASDACVWASRACSGLSMLVWGEWHGHGYLVDQRDRVSSVPTQVPMHPSIGERRSLPCYKLASRGAAVNDPATPLTR